MMNKEIEKLKSKIIQCLESCNGLGACDKCKYGENSFDIFTDCKATKIAETLYKEKLNFNPDKYLKELLQKQTIDGLTDGELEFFIEYNERVRKIVAKEILEKELASMKNLTGCGVPYHFKKYIQELAKEYDVEVEDESSNRCY